MDWEAEIKQGLREEGGALIGGLVVVDYVQGIDDFKNGEAPPQLTSASYDLGRSRAREDAAFTQQVLSDLNVEQERRHQAVREMIKDRPEVLAVYDAKIAAIRSRP